MTNDVGYGGNPNLKKAGTVIQFTKEQAQELLHCSKKPQYFLDTYFKQITIDEGLSNIKMWGWQKKIVKAYHKNRFVITKIPRQSGKALAINTKIPTPNGWKNMGELKVGDKVFGRNGKATTITFATEIMYNHKCYKVTFDSGYEIIADAEHLWEVGIPDNKQTIWKTEELYHKIKRLKMIGQGIKIKNQEAVNYGSLNKLPLPPYILGLWLGDGNKNDGRITCSDYDYLIYKSIIESTGYNVSEFKRDKRTLHTGNFNIYGIYGSLKQLGVLKNKHIPDIYKTASIEERKELIRGLMDSDGCAEGGQLTFSQKKGIILDDTREVLNSLGIKTRLCYKIINNEKYGKLGCSTIKFEMFKLPRKLERQQNRIQGSYQLQNHYIKDIEETDSVPVRCIQVDSEDHLYLCGEGFIPTHNTTITVGYILWYILFNEFKTVGVLAQKELVAKEILSRLKIAYENLPLWMQVGIVSWNETGIELENGSRIIAEATASGSIRGFTINLLYLDEFAHIPPNIADAFNSSVYPTIQSGKTSKVFISSTPKGLNLYYKFWRDAERGINGYLPIEVKYDQVPGHDLAWAMAEKSRLGERMFNQDVLCEFLGSSGTLISGQILRNLVFTDPLASPIEHLNVWEMPQPKHTYVLCADTAEGDQLDYSAFIVTDVTEIPYRQVARYRCNTIETMLYPSIIARVGEWYNKAYVLLENNNLGGQVGDILFYDLEYDNLFYQLSKPNMGVEAVQNTKSRKIGLRTSSKTKAIGCSALKTLIENQQYILTDLDTISELSVFVLGKTGNYKAEAGYNDDLSMSLVLFAWLTQQTIFKDISNGDLRKKLFEAREREINESILPLPEVITQTNPKMGGRLANFLFEKDASGNNVCIWEVAGGNKDNDLTVDPVPQYREREDLYKDFFDSFFNDPSSNKW